jgi:hypothetical protein
MTEQERLLDPTSSADPTTMAYNLARMLGETEPTVLHKLIRIVEQLGTTFVSEVLEETQQVQQQGGMLVADGSRRRTPGGVFFHLVRKRLKQEGRKADLHDLFPPREPTLPPPTTALQRTPPPVPKIRPRRRIAGQTPARMQPVEHRPPPDQKTIFRILENHLGNPPDLYKRTIKHNEVKLAFLFPPVARDRYQAAITAAAEEARVTITIVPYAHQGALTETAHNVLPESLNVTKTSVYQDEEILRVRCTTHTTIPDEELDAARDAFTAQTGWSLDIELHDPSEMAAPPVTIDDASLPLPLHQAVALVRAALPEETGLLKISANQEERHLVLRFAFPDIAGERYIDQVAELTEKTGWHISIYPEANQGELIMQAQQLLPEDVKVVGRPSIYRDQQQVVIQYRGNADEVQLDNARQQFYDTTGWDLVVRRIGQ